MNNRVDFDEYVDNYETLLEDQLSFFSEERDYFSKYKVDLLSGLLSSTPKSVLDFGCGIGLSLPHLKTCFEQSSLFATDLSRGSLGYVREKYPYVKALYDEELDGYQFDLIFVAGVIHHVPLEQRERVIRRLANRLNDGGMLVIFEHNPYNPVTRHMVATCPFDEDAVLITKKALKDLVIGASDSELTLYKSGYCLFFPQQLSALRSTEPYLKWLALGGQQYVMATKNHV